jgi:hypothetical protein
MINDICKRNRTLMKIALITLALLMFILSGCDSRAPKVQKGMKAYLEAKYGIEFLVGPPYVEGDMGNAHYIAKAMPKGQPGIIFIVRDQSKLDKAGEPGDYGDYYLNEKWNYQGKVAIEKKMKEIYGESVDMKVSYDFGGGGYAQKDLDFEQVFEIRKNRSKASINLNIEIFMDSSQFNKEVEVEKAYKILKMFVIDFGSKSYSFDAIFIDKVDKKDYLANSDPYIKKTIKKFDPEARYPEPYASVINSKRVPGCFRLWSSQEEPVTIRSSKDLHKFFRD